LVHVFCCIIEKVDGIDLLIVCSCYNWLFFGDFKIWLL
jgi:hypothetical protein